MRKLLIFVYFISPSIWAQSNTSTGGTENVRDLAADDNTMTVLTFDNRYAGVKGHPYLHDDWTLGSLTTSDGKTYENVELKYDLNRDELSLKKKATSEVVVLFNEQVVNFRLLGRDFVMAKYEDGNHFYEVLTESESPLLARRKKKLLKADYEGAYSAGRNQDEFIEADSEFFLLKNQQLHKLKPNAKSIAQALGVSDKEIKQKIKTQRLLLKDERHLVALMSDY